MTLSMGTKYPVFWFNYSQGVSQLFGSDFDYKKLDFQMRKSFYTKYLGETNIDLKAGMVIGDVPYAKMYSGGGTYREVTICAPGSFGTMRPNEFLSDSYAFLFLSHNFGSLLFKGEKFKPEFELHTYTDADGRFTLAGLEDIAQNIGAFYPGYAQSWKEYEQGNHDRAIEIRLERGYRISCRVVDREGNPFEG